MSNKNFCSSDAVKCSNLQIWSSNHRVFHTLIYLSHLMIFDNQCCHLGFLKIN